MENWDNLCRLCAINNQVGVVETSSEFEELVKRVLAVPSISFELKVCNVCIDFLNDVNDFVARAKKSLNMFEGFLLRDQENSILETTEILRLDCGLVTFDFPEDFSKNPEETSRPPEPEIVSPVSKPKRTPKKKVETFQENDDQPETGDEYFEYLCHICNEKFSKMHPLIEHCKASHDCIPKVNCVCGKTLGSVVHLEIHKRKHFLTSSHLECNLCGLTFKKQSNLEKHFERKHSENAEKLVCSQCNRSFQEPRLLKRHEKTHWPDELKKEITCDLCGQRFVSKSSVSKHLKNIHLKKFQSTCEICGRSFADENNLNRHIVSHSTERIHECNLCHKNFKSVHSLRNHQKTHGERSYECKICHLKFRSSSTLSSHKLLHNNERKYKCTYCPKDFNRHDALKIHLNVHTCDKPFKCQFCSRAFANHANLRKHKIRDHPLDVEFFDSKRNYF